LPAGVLLLTSGNCAYAPFFCGSPVGGCFAPPPSRSLERPGCGTGPDAFTDSQSEGFALARARQVHDGIPLAFSESFAESVSKALAEALPGSFSEADSQIRFSGGLSQSVAQEHSQDFFQKNQEAECEAETGGEEAFYPVHSAGGASRPPRRADAGEKNGGGADPKADAGTYPCPPYGGTHALLQ